MRKRICALLLCLMGVVLCACTAGNRGASVAPASTQGMAAPTPLATATDGQGESAPRRIRVQFGENSVIYQLNDSAAAASLYAQLPLTVEVEDFGTNEKIFYPPQELDASDAPLAQGGAGTLAYYVPWGDVVMFYDDYSQNPSLVELGQVVSGEAWIGQMAGTVTVDIADASEIANRAGGQTL